MGKRARNEYIKIAQELGYDDSVIMKIRNAKTEIECENILTQARRDFFDGYFFKN